MIAVVILIAIVVVWTLFERFVEGGINTVFEAVSRLWSKSSGDGADETGNSRYVIRPDEETEVE